jgi:folate-dependent tRNA-U54 methylase TrmFO/GidA
MKKQIVIILLFTISVSTFGQKDTIPQAFNSTDYLKKSKKQNTNGWILLGSGFAVAAAGVIVGITGTVEEFAGIFTGEESNTFETGAVMSYIGAAAMLGSIPFFIASSKNKRKAREVAFSLKLESRFMVQKNSIIQSGYPALTIKFRL